jgi:exodeoxyribonuclease-3
MKRANRTLRLYCWNVNGIRAIQKKGFLSWVESVQPDVLCLQETKAHQEQLDPVLLNIPGYQSHWCSGERRGYSGVATYTNRLPSRVQFGFEDQEFDREGRVLLTEFPEFLLFNVYFPNGKKDQVRLDYKLRFYRSIYEYWQRLRGQGKKLVICGDYNTAHQEIDLARPKENEQVSGFLRIERDWLDLLVNNGYVDTFRVSNKEPNQYTWWDMMTRARERNVGWRIDYFFVSEDLLPQLKNAWICPEVMGSDHCPIGLELSL